MSNFKTTFTLKQHTPIIHFQANQAGATLRATELKPKFDRFLKQYAFGGNIPPKYKIVEDKEALNYKMKITSNITNNQIKYKTYISKRERNNNNIKEGSYFGDNLALELNDIEIEFFSFHKELITKIKEYFIDFILVTNFGTRQNKGFGSFEVVKEDTDNIKLSKQQIEQKISKYKELIKTFHHNEPLKGIKELYQVAKSGDGMKKKKSELMKYFLHQNKRWEKRWIKRKLYELSKDNGNAKILYDDLKDDYHKPNSWDFKDDEQYFYIRALLGVTEGMEFLTNSAFQLRDAKRFKDADKKMIKVKISHNQKDKIERFKSPITFKVIGNDIFIFCEKENIIPQKLKNTTFSFTISYKNNQNKVNLGTLSTLSSSDDEIIGVFKTIFHNVKLNNSINHKSKNHNNFKKNKSHQKEYIDDTTNTPFADLLKGKK